MDALYIEKIAQELNKEFFKKKIIGYSQKENRFTINAEGKLLHFILSNPNGILIEKGEIEDKSFLKKFRNSYIKSIYTFNKDRLLVFRIVKVTISGRTEMFELVIELTGKTGNVFLIDKNKSILYVMKNIETSVRNTKVGEKYEPPPHDKKEIDEIQFGKITEEGVKKNLYKYVIGISPLNCKEIAYYMKKGLSLHEAYQKFMKLHNNSKEAIIFFDERNRPKFLTTFKYETLNNLKHETFNEKNPFLTAWNIYTKEKYFNKKLSEIKSVIEKQLKRKLQIIEEKLAKIEEPEILHRKAEKFKKTGEILKYYLHTIKPGDKKIFVRDYETDTVIEIDIDPSKTPKENLELLFKKARKLLSRANFTVKEKKTLQNRKYFFEEVKRKIENSENIEELKTLKEELFTENRKRKKSRNKALPIIHTLPSGKKIIIGRNSKENELISLKLSNPWELWFHAKNIPGSHIILKLEKNEIPSEEDIELAASAAAFYSKGKNSGKIEIDFTKVKFLTKPPKTPTGFIAYKNEKTLVVSSEIFENFFKKK